MSFKLQTKLNKTMVWHGMVKLYLIARGGGGSVKTLTIFKIG